MDNKLQELTDKLYKEGLSKGKAEAERLLEKAKKEAEEIVEEAQKQASEIVAKARQDADELKGKVASDLKMASSQTMQATKKDIENILISGICDKKTEDALNDEEFLKEIIRIVAEKFSTQEAQDLSILLPETQKVKFENFAEESLSAIIGKGVEAGFSKKIAGGFTIGPKDGSYFVSFTDDTFKALFAEYLRPVTKKILFGE